MGAPGVFAAMGASRGARLGGAHFHSWPVGSLPRRKVTRGRIYRVDAADFCRMAGEVRRQGVTILIIGVRWPPETFILRRIEGLLDAGLDVVVAASKVSGSAPVRAGLQLIRLPDGNG